MDITEADIADIRASAAKGDDVAKALAAKLSPPEAPKAPPEQTGDNALAPKEEPKADGTPKAEDNSKGTVDKGRESTGADGREVNKANAAKRLDREKRELREALERQRVEMAELKKLIQTSQQSPKPKETTEDDPLTLLLSKPADFTDGRINQALEKFKQEQTKERETLLAQVRTQLKREAEAEQAFKLLQGLEGFEAESESAADDLLDLISEKTGVDSAFLETMARQAPLKFAYLAEKHWKDSRKLSEKVQADKKAASSGTVGVGSTSSPGPVTLSGLESQFVKAKDKKDQDQILEKMEALLYPK